jgi:large subunit ribosomal protein L19
MKPVIKEVTAAQLKKDLPSFKVGDGVRVHTKVREGDKERIQVFSGIVIARKGHGIHESFTVRRISYGEGVERVFPVNSPMVDKIEVERISKPMHARLYYLRDRVGKKAVQVKQKRLVEAMGVDLSAVAATTAPAAPAPAAQ